jgi:hypothetical protein
MEVRLAILMFCRLDMKNFFSFAMICLYVLGVIGGLGWALYSGGYLIAVGVVAVAYMAWDKMVEYYHNLTD